GTSGSPIINR
nr:Chain C, GTS3 peptide [dengue virus type 3]5WJN_F Chain F, GTS3 peptide [dengue virus type 3]5WJN_I Chain I, GTS3 peptide [dengue virus type 3]5WKH_C Chain C, GTS3 peptide [dengue virus type 3]5WKH_H Chain H, GTS3 peptide [dengue virus type 3]